MSDYSGRHVGNYHLARLLGRGGFASVYLGEHRYLGSQAAIKVMPAALTKENRELFLQEARVLAQLNHPGIVRILEFGIDEAGKSTYLAMQYAPSGTTRTLYPRGTRPPLKVISSYIAQVATALQYAHKQKIVHRDIKPENLLLDREGQVLLSDFGIAMIANSVRVESEQDTIAGTIFYMAPEQCQGRPVVASDQYALGIVAYEWLCGQTPFIGSTSEVLAQHLLTPPYPLRYYQPDIPDELEEVVLRALAKEPEKRFPSVSAFAQAFVQAGAAVSAPDIVHGGDRSVRERVSKDYGTLFGVSRTLQAPSSEQIAVLSPATERRQQQVQISAPPEKSAPPTPRLSRRALLVGGVGVAGVAGLGALGGFWFWRKVPLERKAPPAVVTGDEIAVYRHAHQIVSYVAWLPDSKRVLTFLDGADAYIWDAQTGANEQWLYPGTRLYGTTLLKNICLAPDGKQYALATDRGVLLGHLNADIYETLTTTNYLLDMSWSPGSDFLALVTSNELEIWDVRQKKQIYTNSMVKFTQGQLAYMLQWTPGAASLTSGRDTQGVDVPVVEGVWCTHVGTQGTTLAGVDGDAQALAWSPDGKLLAVSYQNADVRIWDVARQRVVFSCISVLKGPQVLAWSPDGRYLLGARDDASKDTNLYVWQMQGGSQRGQVAKVYRGHTKPICSAAWSPDSRMLLSGSGLEEGFATTNNDATARVWRAPSYF